jgi:hypothetical protein
VAHSFRLYPWLPQLTTLPADDTTRVNLLRRAASAVAGAPPFAYFEKGGISSLSIPKNLAYLP